LEVKNDFAMSVHLRVILALTGLCLIACALLALTYAFWPLDGASLQATLPATLFAPP